MSDWIIPELLPIGITLLTGVPGVGKSALALQIARAVASGGQILGRQAIQGQVLYLSLDGGPRKLQNQLRRMNWPDDLPMHVMFSIEKAPIPANEWSLIVIDTLSQAYSGNPNDLEELDEFLMRMRSLGQGIVAIEQSRRAFSTPISANVDAIWWLRRSELVIISRAMFRPFVTDWDVLDMEILEEQEWKF